MRTLHAVVTRLKLRYVESLADKVAALRRLRLSLELNDSVEGARRIAHQLAGSAGTYGWPELGQVARAVSDAPRPELSAALDALLSALERIVLEERRPTPTDILVVEDDDDLGPLVTTVLSTPGSTVHRVRTAAEARAWLKKRSFDLMILDLTLPDGDGRTLLGELPDLPLTRSLPAVVLSACESSSVKVECLALGAALFLEKPLDIEYLRAAVDSLLRQSRRHKKEITHDALTGLTNRTGFREAFERAAALNARAGGRMCLAFLDLDHFKALNDCHGHSVGDEVLRRVGAVLLSRLRVSDVAGRWGGEEFVVLLPNTVLRDARAVLATVAERLRLETAAIEEAPVGPVTFSGGLVEVQGDGRLDMVIVEADRLLYAAKAAGRACVRDLEDQRASPGLDALVITRAAEIAEGVISALKPLGLRFEVCVDVDGAAARLGARPYALAVLDLDPADLGAFDLLRALRAGPALATPLLVMAAAEQDHAVERIFSLGADDFLRAPYLGSELRARARRLIRGNFSVPPPAAVG